MNFKAVLCLICVSLLLFGAVSAQNVSDFKIDGQFKPVANGKYISLYLNQSQDSGITVYKYGVGGDDDDDGISDAYDHLIHDHGSDYLTPDDDYKLNKNSNNTFNFTDFDHAQHGVGEVISVGGEKFVVIFWTKNTSNTTDAQLMSILNNFNKNNNVNPIAF